MLTPSAPAPPGSSSTCDAIESFPTSKIHLARFSILKCGACMQIQASLGFGGPEGCRVCVHPSVPKGCLKICPRGMKTSSGSHGMCCRVLSLEKPYLGDIIESFLMAKCPFTAPSTQINPNSRILCRGKAKLGVGKSTCWLVPWEEWCLWIPKGIYCLLEGTPCVPEYPSAHTSLLCPPGRGRLVLEC